MGGKGKIVVIEGTPKTPTNRERVRGYKRAFGEFPGIQVLGSEVGNYQQPDAKRAMENLMKEHPEIDAVLSANDSMSLGALEALKEANRTATVNEHQRYPSGREKGRNRRNSSYRRFQYVQDWMHGDARRCSSYETLPEKVMLPAEIIDKSNYQAWLTPVEKRACPEGGDLVK